MQLGLLAACGQSFPMLFDHVFLFVAWQWRVFREFHRETALALGRRAQVGGVAEHAVEGHFCRDGEGAVFGHGFQNHAAALIDLANDRALKFLRRFDLHLHHRLEHHRFGALETLAESP